MGGNVGKQPVGIQWGPLPKVKRVEKRFRTREIDVIAANYSEFNYVVQMQPEIKKGATYEMHFTVYVYSGKHVHLDLKC